MTCQQRGVLFCKPCTHFFLPAITLFTPATIHKEHRRFQNFSVTFSEIIMKKKKEFPQTVTPPSPLKKKKKCGAIHGAFVLDQSNTLCLLNVCECGPGDSSVPHLSPTALSRDPLPGPLCREEGRHPRHLPALDSTPAFEHFLHFNGNLSEKAPALRSSHSHL